MLLNKRLNKQTRRWWLETPSRSLSRNCNASIKPATILQWSIKNITGDYDSCIWFKIWDKKLNNIQSPTHVTLHSALFYFQCVLVQKFHFGTWWRFGGVDRPRTKGRWILSIIPSYFVASLVKWNHSFDLGISTISVKFKHVSMISETTPGVRFGSNCRRMADVHISANEDIQ